MKKAECRIVGLRCSSRWSVGRRWAGGRCRRSAGEGGCWQHCADGGRAAFRHQCGDVGFVLDTPGTLSALRELDVQALRFPGGSPSDDYHWAFNRNGTNTWHVGDARSRASCTLPRTSTRRCSSRSITVPARRKRRRRGSAAPTSPITAASSIGRSAMRTTATGSTMRIRRRTTR